MKFGFGIVGIPKRGGGPLVKPAPGSVIATQHPLAQGLVGCWLFHDFRNMVTNQWPTVIGSAAIVGAKLRLPATGDNALEFANLGGVNLSHACISTALALDVSRAGSIANICASEFTGGTYIASIDARTGWYAHSYITADNHRTDGPAPGAGSHNMTVNIGPSVANFYSDGLIYDDTPQGGNANFPANSTRKWGIGFCPGIGRYLRGATYDYLYLHGRPLNASEAHKLYSEPYCFFWEPGRRTIFIPVETGGQIISTRRIKRYGMFFSS